MVTKNYQILVEKSRVRCGDVLRLRVENAPPETFVNARLLRAAGCADPLCGETIFTEQNGCADVALSVPERSWQHDECTAVLEVVLLQISHQFEIVLAPGIRMVWPEQLRWGEPFTVSVEGGDPYEEVGLGVMVDGHDVKFPGPYLLNEKGCGAWHLKMPPNPKSSRHIDLDLSWV